MKVRKHERRRPAEVRCVLCHDHIPSGGVTCPTCGVRFHRACHEGRSGCPTYGCEGRIEDLVLRAARRGPTTTLIGLGLLLAAGGLVAAFVLGVRAELPARGAQVPPPVHVPLPPTAEEEAAARRRAADLRAEQERRLAEQARREERQAEAIRAANEARVERERLLKAEGEADLRARVAAIEAENQQRREQRALGERTRALEAAAAEHVRAVVFRELALHGSVPTAKAPLPGTWERMRAGEWGRGEVKGAIVRADGLVEVFVGAPGVQGACVFVVGGGPDAGFQVDELRY